MAAIKKILRRPAHKIAPPPAAAIAASPKKSEAEVTAQQTADASRDRALRAEQYVARKKKRRRGRSMLMFKDEQGVSDTLG